MQAQYTIVDVNDGDDGKGISSVEEYFYISTSKTTQVGGSWVKYEDGVTIPSWSSGLYMWRKTVITYTDNTTETAALWVDSTWEAINGIQIGGTNLLTTTRDFSGSNWKNKSNSTENGEYLGLTVRRCNTTWNGMYQEYQAIKGETYTFSAYIKTEGTHDVWIVRRGTNGSTVVPAGQNKVGHPTEWTRVSYTFTALEDGLFGLAIERTNNNGIVDFCGYKLERGNKATDWTPAPNDTKADIESGVSEAVSNIQIETRNYIKYGRGNTKKGFFKNFNSVTSDYGEVTLTSTKTYATVDLTDGFILKNRDYDLSKTVVFSFDIMYTAWDFPDGSNRRDFWIGQRYTSPSWKTTINAKLPEVGVNGVELNKWVHVSKVCTVPAYEDESVLEQAKIQFYNNSDVTASFTARIKNVSVVYGSKDIGWTPSPEELQEQIDDTVQQLSDISDDGKLTPNEKQVISREWMTIASEYMKYKQEATSYGLSTLNLETTFNSLGVYLNDTTSGVLLNPSSTTDIDSNELNNKFKDYYDARTDIANEIATAKAKYEASGIVVGLRNLARHTTDEYSEPFTAFTGGDNDLIDVGKAYLIDGIEIGDKVAYKLEIYYKDIVPSQGEYGTISTQGYGDVTGWNEGYFLGGGKANIYNEREHVFFQTFEVTAAHRRNNYFNIQIKASNIASGSIEFRRLTFVKGNKLPDWSLAPEDLEEKTLMQIDTSWSDNFTQAKVVAKMTGSEATDESQGIFIDNDGKVRINANSIITGTLSANLIAANSISANKLSVGDLSNVCTLTSDDFPLIYENHRYRHAEGAYASHTLSYGNKLDFKVDDEYLFSIQVNGKPDTGRCVIRYIYTDDSYSDAGVSSFSFDYDSTVKKIVVKITNEPDYSKVLRSIRYFVEVGSSDSTSWLDLRQENLFVRKRNTGELIVDGSITANNLKVDTLSAISADLGNITAGTIRSKDYTTLVEDFLNPDGTINLAYKPIKGILLDLSNEVFMTPHLEIAGNYLHEDGIISNGTINESYESGMRVLMNGDNNACCSYSTFVNGTDNIAGTEMTYEKVYNGSGSDKFTFSNEGCTNSRFNAFFKIPDDFGYVVNDNSAGGIYISLIGTVKETGKSATAYGSDQFGKTVSSYDKENNTLRINTVELRLSVSITDNYEKDIVVLSCQNLIDLFDNKTISVSTENYDTIINFSLSSSDFILMNKTKYAINNSMCSGKGLMLLRDNQAVFGKYNALSHGLIVVGNGENDDYRHNDFELYEDGLIRLGQCAGIEGYNYETSKTTNLIRILNNEIVIGDESYYTRLNGVQVILNNNRYIHFTNSMGVSDFQIGLSSTDNAYVFTRNSYSGMLTMGHSSNNGTRIYGGNGIFLDGKGTANLTITNDGANQVYSKAIYDRTYSSGATVTVTDFGTLGRISSASKYKLNIQPIQEDENYCYNILKLIPKQWFDKNSCEIAAKAMSENISTDEIERGCGVESIYGLIAEDVEAAGLGKYCLYNEKGELEGIQYERLWTLLIPILNNVVQENKEIKKKIADLIGQ